MNTFHKSDFRCAIDKNMSANARTNLRSRRWVWREPYRQTIPFLAPSRPEKKEFYTKYATLVCSISFIKPTWNMLNWLQISFFICCFDLNFSIHWLVISKWLLFASMNCTKTFLRTHGTHTYKHVNVHSKFPMNVNETAAGIKEFCVSSAVSWGHQLQNSNATHYVIPSKQANYFWVFVNLKAYFQREQNDKASMYSSCCWRYMRVRCMLYAGYVCILCMSLWAKECICMYVCIDWEPLP